MMVSQTPYSMLYLYLFCIFVTFISVRSSCADSNYCNGHGKCQKGICDCYPGWGATYDLALYKASDCSAKICPTGRAWADIATNVDTAHALAECSGRGLCDRNRGTCKCTGNFAGPACERLRCPKNCSGHGRCLNMKNLAMSSGALPLSANTEYRVKENTTAWDSEKIYGCLCDSSWSVGYAAGQTQEAEWFGPDCSMRHCPSGDDPQTAVIETNCTKKITYAQNSLLNGTIGNLCHIDCANRGLCDYKNGICKCFDGFAGSNCAISLSYYVLTDGTQVASQSSDVGLFENLII